MSREGGRRREGDKGGRRISNSSNRVLVLVVSVPPPTKRTELFESAGGRFCLWPSQPRFGVKRLALKIRQLDDVVIDNPDAACAGGMCACASSYADRHSMLSRRVRRQSSRGDPGGRAYVDLPTPPAARYCRAGHPSPPAPTTTTAARWSLSWPVVCALETKGLRQRKPMRNVRYIRESAPGSPMPSRIICLPYRL